MRRACNLYLYAIREWADKERLQTIEDALEAPNVWDSARKAPAWWTSEDDAWSEWRTAARV